MISYIPPCARHVLSLGFWIIHHKHMMMETKLEIEIKMKPRNDYSSPHSRGRTETHALAQRVSFLTKANSCV